MAKLYFSYAAMNAGKSTVLLQASYNYRERGMRTLLFTSALYAEGDVGLIASRIGIAPEAELYGAATISSTRVREAHRDRQGRLRLRRRGAVPHRRTRSGSSPASPTGCTSR